VGRVGALATSRSHQMYRTCQITTSCYPRGEKQGGGARRVGAIGGSLPMGHTPDNRAGWGDARLFLVDRAPGLLGSEKLGRPRSGASLFRASRRSRLAKNLTVGQPPPTILRAATLQGNLDGRCKTPAGVPYRTCHRKKEGMTEYREGGAGFKDYHMDAPTTIT
jgi:hypothetical protein